MSDPSQDINSLNEGSGSAVDMGSINKNGARSKEVSALDAVDVINPETVCIKPATVRNSLHVSSKDGSLRRRFKIKKQSPVYPRDGLGGPLYRSLENPLKLYCKPMRVVDVTDAK